MGKGQKGKISVKPKVDENKNRNSGLLYKFESIKPILDKYAIIQPSQDTDISVAATSVAADLDSDVDNESEKSIRSKRIRREPLQKGTEPIIEM